MAGKRESSLVDFRALQAEPSADRQGELLRNVTTLLGMVSDQSGSDIIGTYNSVMLRLVDMVDGPIRADIAAQLSALRHAPRGVVRKLAFDEIEIAQPLIIRSPVLTDDDLAGLAQIRGNRHRRAIACRPLIGESVTSVLVARGDDLVRRFLAANVTARISPACREKLSEQAETDAEMRQLLAQRPVAPPPAAEPPVVAEKPVRAAAAKRVR